MYNIEPTLWWCLKDYLLSWVIVMFAKEKMVLQLKCYIEIFHLCYRFPLKPSGACVTVFPGLQ